MSFFDFFFPAKPKNAAPLRFKNTLSGKLENFEPLASPVKMYNCGPTVYDRQHIGNLRGPVLADTLRRALVVWGYRVKHVSNITDVGHLVSDGDEGEDKLEASARKAGRKAQDIAEEVTELFFEDLDLLGINRTKIAFPRATEYISQQIALVQALEEKGYAYRISDGIYFDTGKFGGYGKLGNLDVQGQEAGARVEENPEKRNPLDFALWKFSKKDEKRQQEWKSPWGKGFPGWHIECTAMIFELLGKQIDIHIGGEDLARIHHNNEIAQAEAATGKQFVRYWMHNAFITIEGKKVSKSVGNTVYLSQIIDRGFSPKSLRYWYLTGQYRSPMNFTWEAIEGANTALKRLMHAYVEAPSGEIDQAFLQKFYEAIANDLDTPKALALIWEHSKTLNKQTLAQADKILGLLSANGHKEVLVIPEEVKRLAKEREEARQARNWTKADTLRKEIDALGFEVKDTSEGPKISKK